VILNFTTADKTFKVTLKGFVIIFTIIKWQNAIFCHLKFTVFKRTFPFFLIQSSPKEDSDRIDRGSIQFTIFKWTLTIIRHLKFAVLKRHFAVIFQLTSPLG